MFVLLSYFFIFFPWSYPHLLFFPSSCPVSLPFPNLTPFPSPSFLLINFPSRPSSRPFSPPVPLPFSYFISLPFSPLGLLQAGRCQILPCCSICFFAVLCVLPHAHLRGDRLWHHGLLGCRAVRYTDCHHIIVTLQMLSHCTLSLYCHIVSILSLCTVSLHDMSVGLSGTQIVITLSLYCHIADIVTLSPCRHTFPLPLNRAVRR